MFFSSDDPFLHGFDSTDEWIMKLVYKKMQKNKWPAESGCGRGEQFGLQAESPLYDPDRQQLKQIQFPNKVEWLSFYIDICASKC